MGQGGGAVSIALTSANETLPGGTLLTGVSMLVTLGTVTGTTCSPVAGASQVLMPGGAPLSGTLTAGTYCVTVSDATNQLGPAACAVAVTHP